MPDPLALFLPPVQRWFRETLGEPTLPQQLGWPAIASGQHTLILAPTGSGKTLAAFLACLDQLWRQPTLSRSVKILYVSPLKALNNDIHRNLQVPLEGVAATAERLGFSLPKLEAAVRTGDTPQAERQRLVRRPPHVLITTPESLHLLLTSRARETLRAVSHVIVDEIHALCTNKRGVFLSLLLERLEALQRDGPFVRIGLSATQRPLEEVARFLGGQHSVSTIPSHCQQKENSASKLERPVTIIDAGLRKDLDLGVINPVEQFGPLPERSVWPSIYQLLIEQVKQHRSTIIFANDRRSAERITAMMNDKEDLVQAHHGSVDLERRQATEAALKDGRLPAVCATASLELGIDMGAVELVCQVASPGNVARALQRVGRAGHLVGQKSKGRFIPRTQADLLEQAVLVREMKAGRVEAIQVPTGCLDVLAQQLVAMVAMDDWPVAELYTLVRRAYPYRDLSPQAFETTLEMITGRYRFQPIELPAAADKARSPTPTLEALQPRISWDRVKNRLVALPGSQSLVLVNGGTIPDTGQYAACLADGTRIGELDEEFIYERRVGDTFLLGSNAWRLERIDTDRVLLSPAEGAPAIVPFWRGEGVGRSYDLGRAIGGFLRELQTRLDDSNCLDWLQTEFGLDCNAARSLHYHVTRQLLSAGLIPNDEALLVEASRDQLGDWQVVLLSPFGQRLHLGLRFAIEARLHRRLGYQPQCLHHDDGILVRLSDCDEPILDLFEGITPENIEELILQELADSALFALRFRHNAARALLMPRGQAGRRAPLWLQRLRGRELLQVARQHPDFPVVVETFRECLNDHLDVPRLKLLLEQIRSNKVKIVACRADTPSPFASGLLFAFTAASMYQYDAVEKDSSPPSLDRELLEQLLTPESQQHLLDPRAVHQVERRLRGVGRPPRSPAEMAEWLRKLGDLTEAELEGPMAVLLNELQTDGRVQRIELPAVAQSVRWILTEEVTVYQQAFGLVAATSDEQNQAALRILDRFLQTHALVGLDDLLTRYPFERDWTARQLDAWSQTGKAVRVSRGQGEAVEFAAPGNFYQVQRSSLGLLRKEILTCQPAQFAEYVLRWQGLIPAPTRSGPEGLSESLERLQGLSLPVELWEQVILPSRLPGYQPRWLNEWISGGMGVWIGQGENPPSVEQVMFLSRSLLGDLLIPEVNKVVTLSEQAQQIASILNQCGALFVTDLALQTGLTPSQVRQALWSLARHALVSNDQLDVLRRGEEQERIPLDRSRGPSLRSLRRTAISRPEGRWFLLPWGRPTPEAQALAQCHLLLQWYGVVTRELTQLAPWLLPWRILYEVFSKLELAGEVRRGYFVEGLSGAQFALPEAVELLQETHVPSTATAPMVLLHSCDPANLYGSGAAFDVPLLDGGTRPFLRRIGNWLVLKSGSPILLVESQGKKLTALNSASRDDLAAAVRTLPGILKRIQSRMLGPRLTVEEWNGQPILASEGRDYLQAAGFVRDYQFLTLFAAYS